MRNLFALLLCLSTFSVAQAETDIQGLDVATQRYWLLRAELNAKKEAFNNEEILLTSKLNAELEKLRTELAACPDFACAKAVEQKRTKAEKEYAEQKEALDQQWRTTEKSAAQNAVELALSSFAFEASRQVQVDNRVAGYRATPFRRCDNPYLVDYPNQWGGPSRGEFEWSNGRLCKESVVDFKADRSVFQVVLSVGLGVDYEGYAYAGESFVNLDKLFSKSKEELLDEFSRSLQGIIELGNASVHVKWHYSQRYYHFDTFESFGFLVRLVQKIPLDSKTWYH